MSNIQFRRIHGRIVTINVEQVKDTAKGTTLAVAGVAVGGLSGGIAGNLSKKGLRQAKASFNAEKASYTYQQTGTQLDMFKKSTSYAQGRMKASETFAVKAAKYGSYSKAVSKVGTVVSASLIAGGVHKVLGHTKLKDDEKTKAAISIGAGATAGFAVKSFFSSHLSESMTISKSVKNFFSEAGKHIVKAAVKRKVI